MLLGLLAVFPAASENGLDPAGRLDQLLTDLDALAMFNGTVLIERGGKPVYRRSVGLADYSLDAPLGPQTRFRIASLSKAYCDAVVAALVDRGELSLDDPLARWIPDFPAAERIQLRHLLEHRSGVAHTNDQPWGEGPETLSRQEIVRRLARLPLDFEPGADQRYSNGGYAVLVEAMVRASGLDYPDLLRREVLQPLGLENTGVITDARSPTAHLATGWEPGPRHGERRRSRPYAPEMRPGGGDLYSTADDVQRFFSAVWRDDFGGQVGAELFRSDDGPRTYTGRAPGFSAAVLHVPDTDLLVVSLANNYAADFNWAESLAAIAAGEPGFIQAAPSLAPRPWKKAPRLQGDWRYEIERFSQHLRIDVNDDGSFYIEDAVSDTRTALLPLADGGFLETLYYGRCEWVDDHGPRIRCTRWYPEGFVADLVPR